MTGQQTNQRDYSVTITIAVLAGIGVGVILALGGLALAVLTGFGILVWSGPGETIEAGLDPLGMSLNITTTQVGIILCLIGVGLFGITLYILARFASIYTKVRVM